MNKLRPLPILLLTAALCLPASTAFAQDENAEVSPVPSTMPAEQDDQLAALEQLFPTVLAGLPLDENLQVVSGEELASVMSPEESAALEGILEANGRTMADYAAASTWLPISDSDVVVIQAHRIDGVNAFETIEAWVGILTAGLDEPVVTEGSAADRPVTFVSDGSIPDSPQLHLFSAGDVVWMVVAADPVLVEEAMLAVDADTGDAVEAVDEPAA